MLKGVGNMQQSLTKQLLLSSNYWVLNKDVVKLLGLEAAFLLSNFAEAEQIMADEDGWFYQTSDTVEDMTTLSRHKQDQCIKQLEDMGILEKDVRGIPPKRYFKINYECLTNQFVKNQQINMRNFDKSICKKSATNKESIYKKSNYKELNREIECEGLPQAETPPPKSKKAPKPVKNKYGEYDNVLLTDDEFQKLMEQIPNASTMIERLSEYVASTGKKYASHYATIRAWSRKDQGNTVQGKKDNSVLEEFMREMEGRDGNTSLF